MNMIKSLMLNFFRRLGYEIRKYPGKPINTAVKRPKSNAKNLLGSSPMLFPHFIVAALTEGSLCISEQ
jgi:hypothetical protein